MREVAGDSRRAIALSAKLPYQKADQFLLSLLFGEDAGLTASISVVSEDEKTTVVRPRASS